MSESYRLFLVEAEDDFSLLIRKTLERAGHDVTTCRTAADAIIVLSQANFQLVLLDQELPDMTGLELLQNLQREGISTPVLMVTGQGDEHLATQVLHAGALDYVVKDSALTFLSDLPKRVTEAVIRHRLQHLNLLLSEALDSARDGIMITDLQGTILHVNGALEQMTGYARGELLGQNPRVFRSFANPAELYVDLWRTILSRSSWQGELTNRRKDGGLHDVSLTVSPIIDAHGQLTHFVGICRDITDRKLLERQLLQAQKMQSVGTLAGGIAHEFNNLLAGIQGYAALALREPDLGRGVHEFLNLIIGLTDRAASLTRQLLTFARKPALRRQPTDMEHLVSSTADLVTRTLQQAVRVEIQSHTTEGEPLLAQVDSNQFQQVLVNVALNARDAMTTPAPIFFRLRHLVLPGELHKFPDHIPSGDYVVLEVEDSGCGMTPEVLNQALDPFFTTKDVGQGTGLGLPMVFGIVHGHQGFLAIDSVPGKGTTVAMFLPRFSSPADGETYPPVIKSFATGEVFEPETGPGRNILLVDDEPAVLDVVRRFLEIAGHHVHCAQSGNQANDLIAQEQEIDLVILDLMMPGEEESKTLKRINEQLAGVPVLLCTGRLQPDPLPQFIQSGAVGILRKPFRMNELWYAVDQALANRN